MPRPRNRSLLVDHQEILTFPQIRDEKWTLLSLIPQISTPEQSITWLAKRRLLHNMALCEICNNPATFNHYDNGIDKFRWKCSGCNWTQSVRHNSYFSKSHVSLQKLIQLTYFWALDMPMHIIEDELELSSHTIIDWCNFNRDLCCEWVNANFQQIEDSSICNNHQINQQNLVSPHDVNAHMQSIEYVWKRCKKKLRNQSGRITQALFPSYMKECMWRENVHKSLNKDTFSCFCELIGLTYQLP